MRYTQLEVLAMLDDCPEISAYSARMMVREIFRDETRATPRTKPKKYEPDPERHQPVWALMDKDHGIRTGFRMLNMSEADDNPRIPADLYY